jgi:hypothetical protein
MRYVVKYDRARVAADNNVISRMRLAFWATKDADTNSEYVCNAYCSSTTTVITRTCIIFTFIVLFQSYN